MHRFSSGADGSVLHDQPSRPRRWGVSRLLATLPAFVWVTAMLVGHCGLIDVHTRRALMDSSSPVDVEARAVWLGMGVVGVILGAVAAWLWMARRHVTAPSALCWLLAAGSAFVVEYRLALESMCGNPDNAETKLRGAILVLLVGAAVSATRRPDARSSA